MPLQFVLAIVFMVARVCGNQSSRRDRRNALPFEADKPLFFSSLFGTVCGVVDIVHLFKKEAATQPNQETECPFRLVNWIDEDEERRHDGGMRFVSSATASKSRPIVRGIYSFRCSSKSAQTYEETTDFCKSHARSSRRNFSLSKVANWSPTTAASKASFKL
jgi:hypothetical protein